MTTTVYGLYNDAAPLGVYPSASHNADANALEQFCVQMGELFPAGCFAAADFNGAAVGGALSIDISAGTGFCGGSDARKVVMVTATTRVTGLTQSTTNYLYLNRAGTYTANITGVAPTNAILVCTCATDGTEVTSVNNFPSGRVNVGSVLTSLRAAAGYLSKSVAGSANVTLTASEYENAVVEFTGVLTGSINVILPVISGRQWVLINTTTGGSFTVTAKTTSGTGSLVTRNTAALVYCDGTNIDAAALGLVGYLPVDGTGAMTGDLDVADNAIVLTEIVTPGAPVANDVLLYAKDDGSGGTKPYMMASDGVEVELGTGGGGGGATSLPALTDVADALAYTAGHVMRADGAQFTNAQLAHSDLSGVGTTTHANIDSHINTNVTVHANATNIVLTTGAQTVAGVKTFSSIPVGPGTTPTTNAQLADKAYVDSVATGLELRAACRVATTANITLSGAQTIDAIAVIAGDRVLVKDQTTTTQNGIYDCAAGAWSRSSDYSSSAEVQEGTFVLILEGTANAGKQFAQITVDPTLDTSPLVFTQLSAAAVYTGSLGVQKTGNDFRADLLSTGAIGLTGNELKANVDGSSIEIAANALQVKALGVTNAMLAGSIADSKLSQITTASKVSGAALTSLASIPAGAGVVPVANLATGTPSGSKFVRDDGTLAVPAGSGAGVAALNYTKTFANSATPVTVASSAAETTLYTISVPGNTLGTDKVLRILITGQYTNNTGSNKTITFRGKYGGVQFAGQTSGNIGTNASAGNFAIELILAAAGATNTQQGHLRGVVEGGGGSKALFDDPSRTTIDSTGAADVIVTVQHSASSASLSITAKSLHVELLNATDNVGAPTDAKYWLSEANGNLSAEANMGGLTTGLIKHTVAAGVSTPATATDGTDYISSVAVDTTPQLGGALDAQENNIDNVGDIIHDDAVASDWIFRNDDSDKDIFFNCNDGGVPTDIMILDGSAGQLSGMLKAVAGVMTNAVSGTDYAAGGTGVTNGNTHDHVGGDGNQIDHTGLANIGTNAHSAIDTFIASKAAASGLASLSAGSLVVQDPANATATPTASKIPIAEADGDLNAGWIGQDQDYTWTGNHDFGGATGLELPNGTNPTTDTAGKTAVDTSAGAGAGLRVYADVAATLPLWQSKSFTIANPVAGSDYPLWRLPYACTLKQVSVLILGATNVVGQLQEGDANGASGVDTMAADLTATTTNNTSTTFSNASLAAGNYLLWKTTSVSGTPTSLTVTWEYIVDQAA